MPIEIKFEQLPMGYCVESVKGEGRAKIKMIDFSSTEDGQHFVERLEGIPSDILERLGDRQRYRPSSVESLLAVIRKDGTASVYVNEVTLSAFVQVNRTLRAGDSVFKDDIADVHKMRLSGITVPNDAGVLLLFSVGWRRGLFFDLTPLHPQEQITRDYDLEVALGACYAQVMFQEFFRITEAEWKVFFTQRWFPFRRLKADTVRAMLAQIRSGWDLDDLLPRITQEVKGTIDGTLLSLQAIPFFEPHLVLLRRAVCRYQEGDNMSAAAILFPRIEGMMRAYHTAKGEISSVTQSTMASAFATSPVHGQNGPSLLLPEKFVEYLKRVYFADFDPASTTNPISRHTVSHGVASATEFNEKSATIALLIVQQMNYYFSAWTSVTTKMRDSIVVSSGQSGAAP